MAAVANVAQVQMMSADEHLSDVHSDPILTIDKESSFIRLKRLHLAAGEIFLMMLNIFTLFISSLKSAIFFKSKAIFMGVQFIAYIATDATVHVNPTVGFPTSCDGPICSPSMKILGQTNPVWLIALFVALASFDHFVTWIVCHFYEDNAKHWLFNLESNPLRYHF